MTRGGDKAVGRRDIVSLPPSPNAQEARRRGGDDVPTRRRSPRGEADPGSGFARFRVKQIVLQALFLRHCTHTLQDIIFRLPHLFPLFPISLISIHI